MDEFGIVICCCKFDYFLAKGCVAYVRHTLPDVPVTLFIDDDLDARPLAKAFNIDLWYRKDVKDKWLRDTNTGWGQTKMTLFWESPYERTLYLDCDTIMWGDVVSRYLRNEDGMWGEWDMVVDQGDTYTRPWTPGVGTPEWVNKEYFNPNLIEQNYPQFPWSKYMDAYFCTGTFALRRNLFSIDEYRRLLETRAKVTGIFPMSEMGVLNFMIFRAVEEGKINLRREPYELLCDYTNMNWLSDKYQLTSHGPSITDQNNPRILHFTQPKPLTSSYGFHAPFDYFRRQAAEKLGMPSVISSTFLAAEELPWRMRVYYRRKFGGYHKMILNILRGKMTTIINKK